MTTGEEGVVGLDPVSVATEVVVLIVAEVVRFGAEFLRSSLALRSFLVASLEWCAVKR
jgi:hypothetical protein